MADPPKPLAKAGKFKVTEAYQVKNKSTSYPLSVIRRTHDTFPPQAAGKEFDGSSVETPSEGVSTK